ncbi:hypothetical protein FGB62_307g01 [Gracilaria domingensis]|nr:hypothetical protein FGB62_307g01 [Gracilaria domingensis]
MIASSTFCDLRWLSQSTLSGQWILITHDRKPVLRLRETSVVFPTQEQKGFLQFGELEDNHNALNFLLASLKIKCSQCSNKTNVEEERVSGKLSKQLLENVVPNDFQLLSTAQFTKKRVRYHETIVKHYEGELRPAMRWAELNRYSAKHFLNPQVQRDSEDIEGGTRGQLMSGLVLVTIIESRRTTMTVAMP